MKCLVDITSAMLVVRVAFGSSSGMVTNFDLNLNPRDSTNIKVGSSPLSVNHVPMEEEEAVKSPLLATKDNKVNGYDLNMTPLIVSVNEEYMVELSSKRNSNVV